MENEKTTNAIAIKTDLLSDNSFYCSLNLEDEQSQKTIYNALDACDAKIADIIGQELKLKDIYVERYYKEKDGENVETFRTILFDTEGHSYVSTAMGIFNSISRICRIFGTPDTWKTPKSIKIEERSTKSGNRTFVIKLV